jgi:hypothetical protein
MMKMYMNLGKILLLLLFVIASQLTFSQTDSIARKKYISSNILFSYNSSLIYPGLKIGIEIPIYSVYVFKKENSYKGKSFKRDRYFSVTSSWYHQPEFHDNLYVTLEWKMRRTNNAGLFTEFSSGPGYSRTFLGGTTYEVDNSGKVSILKAAGYNYAMIIAGGGLGYDFSKSQGKPISIFYKLELLTMFPYNSTIYFRPAMSLGIIYRPEDFLRIFSGTKIVNK